jgi:hypothetical protein
VYNAPPAAPVQGTPWRWRYSPFVGVMYGPIPVGVIVVAIIGIIYWANNL